MRECKPCPRCNTPYPYLIRERKSKAFFFRIPFTYRGKNLWFKTLPKYSIECDACHLKTKARHTKRGAFKLWDRGYSEWLKLKSSIG